MPKNQHLYQYLYRSLAVQMECGYLLRGQSLPSYPALCRQYNVGITTVRKAVQMLADAGYVRLYPRQPAQVLYSASRESYAAALLRRRKGITDAFQSLGVLMPLLYCEGARRCGPEELGEMQDAVDELREELAQEAVYQQANCFFGCLLRPFHNSLMTDLQTDAETYLRVPYIPFEGAQNPYQISFGRVKAWLETAMEKIRGGQIRDLRLMLIQMYQQTCEAVQDYMNVLQDAVGAAEVREEAYDWFTSKGRAELYMRIAMLLLRRISNGEFEDQKYLPSIPVLMREYGVMKNTASSAVSLLRSIGAAKTLDKKGTVLSYGEIDEAHKQFDFKDPVLQERLILCLHALEIMALSAQAAEAVLPYISTDYITFMETKLDQIQNRQSGSMIVQMMLDCFIEFSPYHGLKNIYQQLHEVMLWGYYLQALEEARHSDSLVIQQAAAFIKAAKTRDAQAFCTAVETTFTRIYKQIYQILSELDCAGLSPDI